MTQVSCVNAEFASVDRRSADGVRRKPQGSHPSSSALPSSSPSMARRYHFFRPTFLSIFLLQAIFVREICALQAPLPLAFRSGSFAPRGVLRDEPSSFGSSAAFLAPNMARSPTRLDVSSFRDADHSEMIVGGERYEMVPLPDSMLDRTLFVGNLNEFVQDGDLSDLFQSVSTLHSLPACVVRKPNMQSLEYGFVSFPTISEKEDAILRFHLFEWRGKRIKVEAIRDHPKMGRVRVPEKIVEYCSGSVKKTRNGVNTMRSISRPSTGSTATPPRKKHKKSKKARTVTPPDVSSLSSLLMSEQSERTPQELHDELKKIIKSSIQKNNKRHRFPPHRLDKPSLQDFHRASRKGFVTLSGTGFRRGRRTNFLANTHRQWCDENDKPHIILCKASGGRPLDNIIVDLSPLRMSALADGDSDTLNELLLEWKKQIISAAESSGMVLRSDYIEDNCETLTVVTPQGKPAPKPPTFQTERGSRSSNSSDDSIPQPPSPSAEAWSTKSIFQLPSLSIGVFEGERSQAKSMARELAMLWDIPVEPSENDFNKQTENCEGKSKHRRQNRRHGHNRVGRNTRNLDWYLQ